MFKLSGRYLNFLLIVLGIIFGLVLATKPWSKQSTDNQIAPKDCNYKFISPLRCDGSNKPQVEYSVFKQKLLAELEKEKQQGNIDQAAVYFRDLNNGPIFYFNEQERFFPMSLLKLPVMVAVYKLAEDNPSVLYEKVKTPEVFAQNTQLMKKEETIEAGKDYSVDQLVQYMMKYSDNRSLDMLNAWLDTKAPNQEILRKTLSDLGIAEYGSDLSQIVLNVKQYISIFRILYNASYLSTEMSEKALGVLSQSNFKDGLTTLLPKDIKIAHKFGVRSYNETSDNVQLHDCGIVYYPATPYMLCIMTRGKDYKKLSDYIEKTSKEIFEEVKSRSE